MSVRDWQPGSGLGLTGRPLRMHPMVVGYEPIREPISVPGGDPARFLLEPVTVAAVVFENGWLLFDSGFNVDVVRDAARRAEYLNYESYTALLPPGDPLADQVAALGLDWAGLKGCGISHVHLDHTGGLRLISAPVLMQRAEYEFARAIPELGDTLVTVPGDFLRPDLDLVLLDGDTALAPGVSALDTRGHTPGHQSFRIELPTRTVVLACDAADLRGNIEQALPCGTTMRPQDEPHALTAIRRLHELDQQPGVEVWPGHDPDWAPWRETTVT
ncbi:MBL fold metallo-hydrolase [Kineosporia sp. J2-2]|uniref:MBL fold metallo-hydrolase n=1 Tax=Kineosporia corallincola TaxID=2835133 RepID=A0ABS5TAE8_9ACTN|nr:MBL fold metallo-hydrolase [Kineosporia corallincola]MBT0768045.1 MBL fold metallo-hydrolase [Kineosporia corallincola]